jgi:hypothetical protein
MNIFILCTGRCGSTTFIKACSHISNFSSAHESRTFLLGVERFNYPLQHIEADNRLSWLLGRLDRSYGNNAFYVHLKRNTEATAASYVKRYNNGGIMQSYRGMGILMRLNEATNPMLVAIDYCDTVNSNIEAFLKDKSNKMQFRLEHGKEDFQTFCSWIDAQVDINAALAEFDTCHNATHRLK